MVAIEGVAAAGEVVVELRLGREHIIDVVIQPLEADRRAEVVPFSGVVEDHVEDDLDPLSMQRADEHLELVHLLAELAVVTVMRLRREEGDRVITPGVRQPLAGGRVAEGAVELVEFKYRQQLYGRDAQLLEIGNLLDEPSIAAGEVTLRRVVLGEPADVDFVDDRFFNGDVGMLVPVPIEIAPVGDAARGACHVVHGARDEVPLSIGRIRVVIAESVPLEPVEVARDGRRVGVEQGLMNIEPGAVLVGLIRPSRPEVVEGLVGKPFHKDVPDVTRLIGLRDQGDDLTRPQIGHVVEQEQLHPCGGRGMNREIDSVVLDGRSQRVRRSRL